MPNEATEIQARIDAAAAEGGGTVLLPPGKVALTRPLVMRSHVTLRGSSTTGSILAAAGAFSLIVVGEDPAIAVEGWTIENLTLLGAGSKASRGHGIEIRGDSLFCVVRHVWIRHAPQCGIVCHGDSLSFFFGEAISIDDCGGAAIVLRPRDVTASSGIFLSEIAIASFGGATNLTVAAIELGARASLGQIHLQEIVGEQIGVRFGRGADFSVLGGCYAGCRGGTPYAIVESVAGVQISTLAVQQLVSL